jgi:hypothetical protein
VRRTKVCGGLAHEIAGNAKILLTKIALLFYTIQLMLYDTVYSQAKPEQRPQKEMTYGWSFNGKNRLVM